MFDAWTSRAGDAYLSFTVHYITAPPDWPKEWQLVNEVLAMPRLEGGHSGSNQADVIMRVVERYDLGCKVSTSRFRLRSWSDMSTVGMGHNGQCYKQ